MRLRTILAVSCLASAPAAAQTIAVGLTVGPAACTAESCLRIVPRQYHPALVARARPDARDRLACAVGFADFVADTNQGLASEPQALRRLLRCRALGLAPLVVAER